MNSEEILKWKEAGKLARNALNFGKALIQNGASMLDVTESIENFVIENNGELAFPTNLAVNNVGAHWTPSTKSKEIFHTGDVVKLDVGVHIEGYIGDNALTVEIGNNKYSKMIEASREALNTAIEVASPGVNVGIIGQAVQDTIEGYGYRPIANLTGHGIKRYNLHSGVSIPSIRERSGSVLKSGDIVAIEPFVTDGAGRVGGKRNSNIYHLRQVRKVRDDKATELMMEIQNRYHGLPFAERWLHSIQDDATKNLQKLIRSGVVSYYPILDELGKGIVTQSEHTIMITSSGVEVLTA
uniref:Methionine aminopeptidase n=1 Tax=uncultured marine group II/III euryarchaeote KM3_67_G08 TaxID=1456485 RepID=A0A075HHK7_9EURY|nr:methionine aminopeptidase type II (map) [uncultured marine group II/III euryarchaeote KM3_67_G08]